MSEPLDLCDYCGKTDCRCYDESDPEVIIPSDSTTNPAV